MLEKLDEICRVAAVKASASLSKMINVPVGVDILPAVQISDNHFPILMDPEEPMVSLTIPITGDLNGVAFMFFPRTVACTLCDLMLLKNKGETKIFTEMESAALVELSNIVIGNFLNPFAHPLQLDSVMHRTPIFKADKYADFLLEINNSTNNNVQESAMVEIVINLNHTSVKGFLIIMLGIKQITQAIAQVSRERNG